MKTATGAWLRRICNLLEWISASKSDSTCIWRGQPAGTWRNLNPSWRICGGKVRLRFSIDARSMILSVSAVKAKADSATVFLEVPGNRFGEILEVNWSPRPDELTAAGILFSRALARWALAAYPGATVDALVQRADRAHTISGSFVRLRL